MTRRDEAIGEALARVASLVVASRDRESRRRKGLALADLSDGLVRPSAEDRLYNSPESAFDPIMRRCGPK